MNWEREPMPEPPVFVDIPAAPTDGPKSRLPADAVTMTRLVRRRDITVMTRQLATLLHAGMPLVPALQALHEQLQEETGRHRQLARMIGHLHDRVTAGASLSEAMGDFPAQFPPLYLSLVVAGETGGTLEQVLGSLADNLEKRQALAGKIKAAAIYPVVMALVAIGVVVFLLAHVVPSITQIFQEMGRSLPMPTRILIVISALVNRYYILLLLAAVAGIAGLLAYRKSPRGRAQWDTMVLRIPLLRPFLIQLEITRLARTLAMLLGGGVPILKAMEVTQGILQNTCMQAAWTQIRDQVQKGKSLAEAMKGAGLFPAMVCHVVATGQHTGAMESTLFNISDMYDTQLEATLKALTSLLEPLILVVMGALIGFVVMAILLPIFEINQAL
jgi:general secretion pathway protein F